MEENVTLLTAFGAGLLSFISPCVLPLIPGYLSYISGLSLDEMRGTPAVAGGSAGFLENVVVLRDRFTGFELARSDAAVWWDEQIVALDVVNFAGAIDSPGTYLITDAGGVGGQIAIGASDVVVAVVGTLKPPGAVSSLGCASPDPDAVEGRLRRDPLSLA